MAKQPPALARQEKLEKQFNELHSALQTDIQTRIEIHEKETNSLWSLCQHLYEVNELFGELRSVGKRLPIFHSEKDVDRFWRSHDIKDYMGMEMLDLRRTDKGAKLHFIRLESKGDLKQIKGTICSNAKQYFETTGIAGAIKYAYEYIKLWRVHEMVAKLGKQATETFERMGWGNLRVVANAMETHPESIPQWLEVVSGQKALPKSSDEVIGLDQRFIWRQMSDRLLRTGDFGLMSAEEAISYSRQRKGITPRLSKASVDSIPLAESEMVQHAAQPSQHETEPLPRQTLVEWVEAQPADTDEDVLLEDLMRVVADIQKAHISDNSKAIKLLALNKNSQLLAAVNELRKRLAEIHNLKFKP